MGDEDRKLWEKVSALAAGEEQAHQLIKMMEDISRCGYREGWNDCKSSSFGDSSWDPPVAWLRACEKVLWEIEKPKKYILEVQPTPEIKTFWFVDMNPLRLTTLQDKAHTFFSETEARRVLELLERSQDIKRGRIHENVVGLLLLSGL